MLGEEGQWSAVRASHNSCLVILFGNTDWKSAAQELTLIRHCTHARGKRIKHQLHTPHGKLPSKPSVIFECFLIILRIGFFLPGDVECGIVRSHFQGIRGMSRRVKERGLRNGFTSL